MNISCAEGTFTSSLATSLVSRQFLFVLLNTSKITLNIFYLNNTRSTIPVSVLAQHERGLLWEVGVGGVLWYFLVYFFL